MADAPVGVRDVYVSFEATFTKARKLWTEKHKE